MYRELFGCVVTCVHRVVVGARIREQLTPVDFDR
jgi:hypothetical protein